MFVRALCRRTGGQPLSWNSRAIMPLRAKLINPAFVGKAKMSTNTEENPAAADIPEDIDEPEDVLFNATYGLRTIELNRPSKLHSLNGSMIRKIIPRLQEWAKSDMANVIVMKGSGPRALCAGGDVATLAKWNKSGPEGQEKSINYFLNEYQLDHLIATYTKPYIAFMDGITMGGGVGLSVHAPFRIATERTVFAMPETTIGFFPDVGASFFLPKMPGATGIYLALTSERLTGVNAFYAGIATHYIHSSTLPALEARLAELRFKDYEKMDERLSLIDSTIEEYCTGLPHDQPILFGGELRKSIDRCFSEKNIEAILKSLKEETEREGGMKEWAEKTLETLHQRSPTSVVTTLRQMQVGKKWNIRDTFHREYNMAAKFMRHNDFTEGVSALLISKPKRSPAWEPATLEDITPEMRIADEMLDVDETLPFDLLDSKANKKNTWHEYPWRRFGIPTEQEVESTWKQSAEERKDFSGKSRQEIAKLEKMNAWERRRVCVLDWFGRTRKGKQGVKEVVDEIIQRKAVEWGVDE